MTRRACPGLDPGASEASRESSCKSVLKRRMSAFAVFWQDYSPLCGSPFGSCAKRMFASAFGLRDPDRRFAPSGMTNPGFTGQLRAFAGMTKHGKCGAERRLPVKAEAGPSNAVMIAVPTHKARDADRNSGA